MAQAVLTLLERGDWIGTATKLLKELNQIVGESAAKAKNWPKNPKSLRGILNRLSTNLLSKGVEFKPARKKERIIELIRQGRDSCDATDACDADPEKQAKTGVARTTQTTQGEILTTPEKPLFSWMNDAASQASHKNLPCLEDLNWDDVREIETVTL